MEGNGHMQIIQESNTHSPNLQAARCERGGASPSRSKRAECLNTVSGNAGDGLHRPRHLMCGRRLKNTPAIATILENKEKAGQRGIAARHMGQM